MSGQISARTIEALKLHMAGLSAYAAARRAGIDVGTMYRNQLYKRLRDCGGDPATIAEIRKQLDVTRPVPRRAKKPQRFSSATDLDS